MEKLETKQHIYKIAKELFYKQGYSATTMRNIAKRAESSLGLPIYYFGSKENLGVEIYKEYRYKLRAACKLYYPGSEQETDCDQLCIVADNALLLTNPNLKDLYVSVAASVEMGDFMYEFLLKRYSAESQRNNINYLNALTVPTVKASIINADLRRYNIEASEEEIMLFLFCRYVRFQKNSYINSAEEMFYQYYKIYKQLNPRLMDGFDIEYNKPKQ